MRALNCDALASLHFDVEACTAAAAARGKWVVHYFKLASDELHGVVHLAPLEQIQTWLV